MVELLTPPPSCPRRDTPPRHAAGTPSSRASTSFSRRLQRIPVDLIHLVVMRGLDPRIHHLRKIYARLMDPRVKPAGDGSGWASTDSNRPGAAVASKTWMAGTSAAMTPGDVVRHDRNALTFIDS